MPLTTDGGGQARISDVASSAGKEDPLLNAKKKSNKSLVSKKSKKSLATKTDSKKSASPTSLNDSRKATATTQNAKNADPNDTVKGAPTAKTPPEAGGKTPLVNPEEADEDEKPRDSNADDSEKEALEPESEDQEADGDLRNEGSPKGGGTVRYGIGDQRGDGFEGEGHAAGDVGEEEAEENVEDIQLDPDQDKGEPITSRKSSTQLRESKTNENSKFVDTAADPTEGPLLDQEIELPLERADTNEHMHYLGKAPKPHKTRKRSELWHPSKTLNDVKSQTVAENETRLSATDESIERKLETNYEPEKFNENDLKTEKDPYEVDKEPDTPEEEQFKDPEANEHREMSRELEERADAAEEKENAAQQEDPATPDENHDPVPAEETVNSKREPPELPDYEEDSTPQEFVGVQEKEDQNFRTSTPQTVQSEREVDLIEQDRQSEKQKLDPELKSLPSANYARSSKTNLTTSSSHYPNKHATRSGTDNRRTTAHQTTMTSPSVSKSSKADKRTSSRTRTDRLSSDLKKKSTSSPTRRDRRQRSLSPLVRRNRRDRYGRLLSPTSRYDRDYRRYRSPRRNDNYEEYRERHLSSSHGSPRGRTRYYKDKRRFKSRQQSEEDTNTIKQQLESIQKRLDEMEEKIETHRINNQAAPMPAGIFQDGLEQQTAPESQQGGECHHGDARASVYNLAQTIYTGENRPFTVQHYYPSRTVSVHNGYSLVTGNWGANGYAGLMRYFRL